jgi:hypothetical protein
MEFPCRGKESGLRKRGKVRAPSNWELNLGSSLFASDCGAVLVGPVEVSVSG